MFPLVAIVASLVFSVLENKLNGRDDFSVGYSVGTSGSGLRNLYNTHVTKAELVQRHKQGVPNWVPKMYPTTHSGVRVTLEDGSKYLIHKGKGYGKASDTVVTDAAHMSNGWEVKQTKYFGGSKTVGDMVKGGGENYGHLRANCHKAAEDMMKED